jgi:hypothetical protein
LLPYFNFYCFGKKYIDFDKLKKLTVDFGLFPDLISIKKIKLYFKQCINRQFSDKINEDVFDINSLVHFIALCSLEIPFHIDTPDSVSRIIFLLQKISDSEGIKKVVLQMGKAALLIKRENIDILSNFKLQFPQYFNQKSQSTQKENNSDNFSVLMGTNY